MRISCVSDCQWVRTEAPISYHRACPDFHGHQHELQSLHERTSIQKLSADSQYLVKKRSRVDLRGKIKVNGTTVCIHLSDGLKTY